MPNIVVTPKRIIVGPVSRFEIDDIDIGSTRGSVVVRRAVQQIDINTDIGSVVDKFRSQDRMFIDVDMAESTFDNLKIVWGGELLDILDMNSVLENRILYLRHSQNVETTHKLVLEGRGVDGLLRRYVFPRAVSLFQSNQTMGKIEMASIPITFEVLANLRNFDTNVGLEGEVTISRWHDNLDVVEGQIVVDGFDMLYVASADDNGMNGEPSENVNFELYDAQAQNIASFGSIIEGLPGSQHLP